MNAQPQSLLLPDPLPLDGGAELARVEVAYETYGTLADTRGLNGEETVKRLALNAAPGDVGGPVFDAVLPLLNTFARVLVCGRIASYSLTGPPEGPDQTAKLMGLVLVRRLTIRGFIVFDHASREPEFLRDVGGWIERGELRYREDVVEGLEHAVSAFQGLLQGKNFGKLLVRVSDDPTRPQAS